MAHGAAWTRCEPSHDLGATMSAQHTALFPVHLVLRNLGVDLALHAREDRVRVGCIGRAVIEQVELTLDRDHEPIVNGSGPQRPATAGAGSLTQERFFVCKASLLTPKKVSERRSTSGYAANDCNAVKVVIAPTGDSSRD